MLQGNQTGKILIISDCLRVQENAEKVVLAGHRMTLLSQSLRQAGIKEDDVTITVMYPTMPKDGKSISRIPSEFKEEHKQKLKQLINELSPLIIVPMGEEALQFVTGLKGIQKWHSSILKSRVELGGRFVVPVFHPNDVLKNYTLHVYLVLGMSKVKHLLTASFSVPERKFWLNPTFEDTLTFLREKALLAPAIAVDLEFGRGQINTVGFAISPTEAIAIQVLPDRLGPDKYYQLWQAIREVAESDIPKIAHNAIIETQWFSRYGIWLNNVIHDTMWCMKFLNPELEMGLDNAGRVYTPYPYWKDDNESWNDIRDWPRHYDYNCKDTTGTYYIYQEQQKELSQRNLAPLWEDFVMCFFPPIREMCSRGLPLNADIHARIKAKVEAEITGYQDKINTITLERLGRTVNPRSIKIKNDLKEMGIQVPVVKGKQSTDKKALTKLVKKYPKEEVLKLMLKLSAKNKLMSSYINFKHLNDGYARYSLNGCATETGRWNSKLDAFNMGFNAQTVPKSMRAMFAPSSGYLVQIDLAQAESRYVAWEAPEPTLMKLIQEKRDIHRFVAARIFKKPEETIGKSSKERQLGKKSGHAANYGVGPRTFVESCMLDGIFITETEARKIIDGYFETFPGIRKRQEDIRVKVSRERKLVTPLGRVRHFYGRMGDDLFRQAYAHCPQSTIPDITNHLMLYLFPHFPVLLQVHDSVLLHVDNMSQADEVAEMARAYDQWHPEIHLPGGQLIIPTDVEVGDNWKDMTAL